MDAFYTAKIFKLQRLLSQLDSALHTCGDLARHEAGAPAGEEGYTFDVFADLSEIHARIAAEVEAVRVLAATESRR